MSGYMKAYFMVKCIRWQVLGMNPNDIEHIIYDKTREIRERDEEDRKRSEEHFERVLLKPDSFEWHKLYYNNCIPKDENTDHEQKL